MAEGKIIKSPETDSDSAAQYIQTGLWAKRSGKLIILAFRGITLDATDQDVIIADALPAKYASSITMFNLNFPIFDSQSNPSSYTLAGNGYVVGNKLVFHNRSGKAVNIVGSTMYMGS